MSSSEFNPDLGDLNQYTSIKDIKPCNSYSIRGVLVDYDMDIRRGQKLSFVLMDNDSKIEVYHFVGNDGVLIPNFSMNYQAVVIHNIKIVEDERGSLLGRFNMYTSYKILSPEDLNDHPDYLTFIDNVKEACKNRSFIPTRNFESCQVPKRAKYAENIESTQYGAASSSQSQSILDNDLPCPRRNTDTQESRYLKPAYSDFPESLLNGIEPGNNYQIVAQVLKKERSYDNRDEYFITDYSKGDNLRSGRVKLPNSKVLIGKYFLKLVAWGDQRECIKEYNFYHFSSVISSLDKMGQLELSVYGVEPNVESSATDSPSDKPTSVQEI